MITFRFRFTHPEVRPKKGGSFIPYDEKIERSIDTIVARWKGIGKKRMFGGICYLINDNMCFAIYKNYVIVRMSPEKSQEKLKYKHTRPFDITGRIMKGWVMVQKSGYSSEKDMRGWLQIGKNFAKSLPKK